MAIILSIVLTASFCALAWLGLGIYGAWLPPSTAAALTSPWRMVLGLDLPMPWQGAAWQAPALVSLLWAAFGPTGIGAPTGARGQRLLAHLMLVFTLALLLGIVMILPLVDIASVLR